MSDYFISIERAENDLLACAAFLAERIKSSEGHAEAMKAILPRYLAKGDVDLAAELANAVDDPFSRDRLLTIVAEKCAEIDDYEYATQLAEAIEDDGLRAQALERIGLILAGKGEIEKAAEMAASMSHPDFVFAGIAVRQTADGDDAAATETLDGIAFSSARVSALQQIAAARIEEDNSKSAVEMLDRAVEEAIEIEHDEERIRSLCEICNLFVDAKRKDKAVETFEKARGFAEVLDNIHRDFFLSNCALGFLSAGSDELTDRTLDLITDKTQMASALLGIARDHWKKLEKDDAMETLEEAYAILKSQRDIEIRDSRARNGLLASIAAQFAIFGKTERAFATADENRDIDEQVAALSQIAQICTMQHEDELARQAIEAIPDDASRLFALVSVADAKEKLGENAAAIAMLDEAATLVETVPQLASRSNVLNELAMRFAGHSLPDRAREISLANLEVISQIRDESSRAAALANISDIYNIANYELADSERAMLERMVRHP